MSSAFAAVKEMRRGCAPPGGSLREIRLAWELVALGFNVVGSEVFGRTVDQGVTAISNIVGDSAESQALAVHDVAEWLQRVLECYDSALRQYRAGGDVRPTLLGGVNAMSAYNTFSSTVAAATKRILASGRLPAGGQRRDDGVGTYRNGRTPPKTGVQAVALGSEDEDEAHEPPSTSTDEAAERKKRKRLKQKEKKKAKLAKTSAEGTRPRCEAWPSMPPLTNARFKEMREVCKTHFPEHCMFWLTGRCTKTCGKKHEKPARYGALVVEPFKNG
jgi:hypothetical protein